MTVVLMPRMQTSRVYEFMGGQSSEFPIYPTTRERGIRVGGGVHDSYTFQCGLVGSFTSPGIDTR